MLLFCLPFFAQAATVSGTLTYSDDASGIENASVILMPMESGEGTSGVTDASGNFSMTADNGEYFVSISFQGDTEDDATMSALDWYFNDMDASLTVSGDTTYNPQATRATAMLKGAVTPSTINGDVMISNNHNYFTGIINGSGNYYIPCATGTYTVNYYPYPDNERYYWADDGATQVISAGQNTLDITLAQKTAYVTITVLSEDSSPVENANVSVFNDNEWLSGITDASGQVTIWTIAGTYEVSVDHEEQLQSGENATFTVADGENTSVSVTMASPNTTIVVSLVDSNGDLVETDGYVFCFDEDYTSDYGATMTLGSANIGLFLDVSSMSGFCNVSLNDMSLGAIRDTAFTVGLGETLDLDVTLIPNDAAITVNVQDVNGDLLTGTEGGMIFLANNYGNFYDQNLGSTGSETIAVAAGEYFGDVYFMDNNNYVPLMSTSTTTVASEETGELNLTVLEADAAISGIVTDPNGDNISYGTVFCGNWNELSGSELGSTIDTFGEITDGVYSVSVVSSYNYTCGVGVPPELMAQGWIAPVEQEVTLSGGVGTANFQFEQSDATVSGDLSVLSGGDGISVASVDELDMAFCGAFSDEGGHTYSEATIGQPYELYLMSGREWYIFCDAFDEENNQFYTAEATINAADPGDYTQDLTLELSDWIYYDPVTKTFDATSSKTIVLPDGTEVYFPANAGGTSGDNTFYATPSTEIVRTRDRQLHLPWDFKLYNEGTLVESFNSNVTVTIPYDEELLTELGIDETSLAAKYYDDTAGSWRTPDSVSQDTENNTITILTSHFTQFGTTYNSSYTGLSTPDSLQVKKRTARTVSLRWSSAGDYNKVQVRNKKGVKVKTFASVEATKKKLKKKYTRSNKGFKFRTKSCNNSDKCSSWSNYKSFRTLPAKVKKVRFNTTTKVAKWKKVRGKGVTYQVKLLNKKKKKIKTLKTTKKKKKIKSKKAKYFKVRAKYNKNNKGNWSKIKRIR